MRLRTASGSALQPTGQQYAYFPHTDEVLDPTMAEFGFKLMKRADYEKRMVELGFVIDRRNSLEDFGFWIKNGYQR